MVTSLASLAGRRLATGVIAGAQLDPAGRQGRGGKQDPRIRDLPAQLLLLDNVVPDQQGVPPGLLRPAGHLCEDLWRREFPEVRDVDRVAHSGSVSSGTDSWIVKHRQDPVFSPWSSRAAQAAVDGGRRALALRRCPGVRLR